MAYLPQPFHLQFTHGALSLTSSLLFICPRTTQHPRTRPKAQHIFLDPSTLQLGVSKDPHNPTRPPETARTEGPRAAPNPPTVGHGLKSAQPEFCGSDPGFKIFHPENPNRPN